MHTPALHHLPLPAPQSRVCVAVVVVLAALACAGWLGSRIVNRKRRPSGENRGANGIPDTAISSCESVPSALQMYRLELAA